MAREERIECLSKIEEMRGSRVLTYVTGDRPPVPAQIGDDAVRPLIALLREIGYAERIDLFLYTRGGAIDVPWRIVRQLRQHCDTWSVLIPFRANSAGTLIALGADGIVLTGEGELGPIDPSMDIQRMVQSPDGPGTFVQDNISVEDVMAYVRFIGEQGGLSDQGPIAQALTKLVDRVDPVSLGSVYRTHAHIRDVARRILASRKVPPDAETQGKIVKTLAEHVYAHGHAIGFEAAAEMGLPVERADDELDGVLWDLLGCYEADLLTRRPVDPASVVSAQDRYAEPVVLAVAESARAAFEFAGELEVKAKRNVPAELNVALNLQLQLPAGFDAAQAPPEIQALLQQLAQQAQQAALQQVQPALQAALSAQAPLIGTEVGLRGGRWREVD